MKPDQIKTAAGVGFGFALGQLVVPLWWPTDSTTLVERIPLAIATFFIISVGSSLIVWLINKVKR